MAERAVHWTATAKYDLSAIIDYIAAEDPQAALSVLDTLQQHAASLESLSERGRIVPELGDAGLSQYRELVVKPWRILYLPGTDAVHVVAVLDGRRDLQTLLLERLMRS
jgi:toxin ParE1/3/4